MRLLGHPDRIDIFNGNYGMFRGISSSILTILVISFIDNEQQPLVLYLVLVISFLLSLYRMHRFGIHYARELYIQFLTINVDNTKKRKKGGNQS